MSAAVPWFRRDLRLSDHPALLAAADEGPVTALFVLDDELRRPSGAPRVAFMYRTLPGEVEWRTVEGTGIPQDPKLPSGLTLPEAGEEAALDTWRRFRRSHLSGYASERDRPDLNHTSRISPYLKWGSIHPRTILDGLGGEDSAYRREIAWREFYAAVRYFWPESAREYFLPEMAKMPYASGQDAEEALTAWAAGRTGYPIVDAGLRQLLAEGWMHNRLRMIVASFLVKDLHVEWTRGARHFMRHLVDGDLASNQHGWQWTAGTGTDAAPYFRIFNPVTQGKKFDPTGDYIRRYVPEQRELSGKEIHEPWERAEGLPAGYPERIVDHAEERNRSLANYQHARGR